MKLSEASSLKVKAIERNDYHGLRVSEYPIFFAPFISKGWCSALKELSMYNCRRGHDQLTRLRRRQCRLDTFSKCTSDKVCRRDLDCDAVCKQTASARCLKAVR